jgi:E3 ubiquitin-protein ligase UBR4
MICVTLSYSHGFNSFLQHDDDEDEERRHYGEVEQSGYVDGHAGAGGYSEDDDEDDDHDRMELDEMEDVSFFRAAGSSRAAATSALAAALAGSNTSALAGASHQHHNHHQGNSKRDLSPPLKERQRAYVQASMLVMSRQYPAVHHHHQQQQPSAAAAQMPMRQSYLTVEAENSLLESINRIVKPPKKPIHTKIIMRRAPTQEEFFRGSLSRNPISVDSLARSTGSSSGGENAATTTTASDSYEPTVGDLRQHIANDLQMADSAELIEIIVANKILDMSLKLRVVHQVLWRKHLMENASSSSAPGGPSFFAVGSGLSMILSTTGGGAVCPINADTPLSQLPPIIAMYRLAGVDGEATEDTIGVDELIDPEAPASADSCTPEELQRLLEKDFGITRIVTEGRGIFVLLRSIQHAVADTLRRIRRDDVVGMVGATGICRSTNPSRAQFQTSPPCQGLTLLRHCSRLPCNRKMLLEARAPTGLLTLLLDVLKSLEDDTTATTKSNPTADILQELIEVLASDISTGASSASNGIAEAEIDGSGYESDAALDASSMPMLLESIETIALSAPLRKIIGKLLPFLTYGQADLSRTLAQHFDRHIVVEALEEEKEDGDSETQDANSSKSSTILMHTFVQTAMSLPANTVCNSLRTELINCGFIDRLALFIIKDMPRQPPSWSHALWPKVQQCKVEEVSMPTKGTTTTMLFMTPEVAWRQYYARNGIQTAFRILTGLCKSHKATQARVAMFAGFLQSCHWIEATSDSSSLGVNTNGLGLLAETLLDEMMEGNRDVNKLVEDVRKKTRLRKKELAQERRNKALGKMSAFGPLAGSAAAVASNESESATTASASASSSVRGAAASILARSVLGFFGGTNAAAANSASAPAAALPSSSSRGARISGAKNSAEKPSWMTEMESMQDETGLTCAICQEGRTLLPEELLGLYAFVKKVSIPLDHCGARSSIDGSVLLKALPSTLPGSLQGTRIANTWFPIGKAAGEELTPSSSMCTSSGGRRMSLFTTTVSAGNGIHLSCHRRARNVDRTHPKAPKSEWEGAKLRNGRVDCNIILPLVSSRSSKVSLIAVDAALSEHQSAVANLLGATPKSMLWTNLYDTRFLLLRMAYGEALDTDCGGGSLESNCNLLFYQMVIAATFDRDAQMEQPDQSQHARGLSAGFIAACALVTSDDYKGGNVTLTRGIADAAPMACLTSILFHNGNNDGGEEGEGSRSAGGDNSGGASSDDNEGRDYPHPNRRWVAARDYFLRGLVICAGRRHALRLESSGCWTSRNVSSRQRTNAYAIWDDAPDTNTTTTSATSSTTRSSSISASAAASASRAGSTTNTSDKLTINDFQHALRPMITFYAMMEQLSAEFSLNMEDVAIRQGAERLARSIEDCVRCKDIHQLLATAKVTMASEALLELLQKGMVVA